MAWSADSAYDKVWRVGANLKALDAALMTYTENDPHAITAHFEADTGWHSVCLLPRPPGPEFGLIVGEAVHNLRSALDHVAWQLANLDGVPADPNGVQFPMLTSEPKDFYQHRNVNGMREEHKAVLESLQPYKTSEANVWPVLAWLSNTDKHRTLHTTASVVSQLVPHALQPHKGSEIAKAEFGYTGLLEGETEIGRLLVYPKNPELQVHMQINPAIGVVFGERDSPIYGADTSGYLKVLQQLVEGVIDLFDRPGENGSPPWP